MTNAIAIRQDTSVSLIQAAAKDIQAAAYIAEAVCRTALVPEHYRNKSEDGAAAILYGATIGMDPMTSLQQIYVYKGKPALYARGMVAIVLAAGHEVWCEAESEGVCTMAGKRKGSDHVHRITWTIEDAKRAGYFSNKKYETDPRSMLYARASGDIARRVAPDALLGMAYNVEELLMTEPATPGLAPAANQSGVARLAAKLDPTTVVEQPAPEHIPDALPEVPILDQIAEATDVEALRALYTAVNARPDAKEIQDAILARVTALKVDAPAEETPVAEPVSEDDANWQAMQAAEETS